MFKLLDLRLNIISLHILSDLIQKTIDSVLDADLSPPRDASSNRTPFVLILLVTLQQGQVLLVSPTSAVDLRV